MFTQPFIQTQIKENIKAPRHWPLCGEFTGNGEFPAQRASYAEWWRHHEIFLALSKNLGLHDFQLYKNYVLSQRITWSANRRLTIMCMSYAVSSSWSINDDSTNQSFSHFSVFKETNFAWLHFSFACQWYSLCYRTDTAEGIHSHFIFQNSHMFDRNVITSKIFSQKGIKIINSF